MLQAQSYQQKVSVVFLLFPLQHSPFISLMAASSSLICWDEKDCMCHMGYVFFSLPIWKWFFGRPAVSRALWNVMMRLLCSSLEVPSAVPAALPSQEMCPVSQPTALLQNVTQLWLSRETGAREGWYLLFFTYSVLWAVANGFCVDFFLVLSRFSSSVGSLYSFFSFKWGT